MSSTNQGVAPDDPVGDDEWLLRFVPDSQLVPGEHRVQSEMFRHPSFSVDREALKPLSQLQTEHQDTFVARFTAGGCRTVGYDATPDPIPGNPAHGLVIWPGSATALRRAARRLRDEYVELIIPSETD